MVCQCDHPLPTVIYLDDIAIYRDTQEQVLEYVPEAINWLTAAGFGFVLNLYKSQLFQPGLHPFN